jgi:regulator of extracellular matrix RemA (YlzA/DUF370 family)
MLTPAQMKAQYERINLSKVEDADLVSELKGVAERTLNFSDERRCAAAADNFTELMELVKDIFPEAIEKEKKPTSSPKKEPVKPAAKTKETKKAAPKLAPVNDQELAECEAAIREKLQRKKNQKLREYKQERLAKVNEQVKNKDLTEEEAKAKRTKIEELTYQEVFVHKKTRSEKLAGSMVTFFEEAACANYETIERKSKEGTSDKVKKLQALNRDLVKLIADTFLPKAQALLIGDKSEKVINDFKTQAEKIAKEFEVKLEKKIEKETKKAA